MKKSIQYYFIVVFVFGFLGVFNAQTPNPNISESNKELLRLFEEQEAERLDRVNGFLSMNPDVKASIDNDENKLIYIYDIIDGKPIYKATDNLNAGRATKTNRLQPGGSLGLDLDGTGITIGIWDGGPAQADHPEFVDQSGSNSRITVMDNATVDGDSGPSSHGTHVTGTVAAIGADPNALGMAPNVNVKSYNWTNDESEMVLAVTDATNPIIISNHSYGVPIDQEDGNTLDAWFMGAYTQDARDIDNIARNNPKYLVVASAGNNGQTSYTGGLYSGYDKLTSDKNAKNNLVVANASPSAGEQPLFSGNYELTNLAINSGSSQGPTDDLRIKPDIAADGTGLYSPVPTNSYATFSGTSMASPNTAGTLLLLQQYYFQLNNDYMNSSTLKALVCHNAIDDIAAQGPDPKFGWGFLDANASVETIADNDSESAIVDELTLDEGQTYTLEFNVQEGSKLKATIAWTDMPGNIVANGTLNDPTPRLVNDLDLRLTKDGNTYFPWRLDYSETSGFSNSKGDNTVDNIEVVEIDVPEAGTYTLTVSHKGSLQGTEGGPFDPQSQDFSLIVTGSNLTLGVGEKDLANSLLIYPNPTNGEFTLSFESNFASSNHNVKVDVYDMRGRLVYNNKFDNNSSLFKETISLNDIMSGVYIVNVAIGNRVTSHKLIVE